MGWERRLIQAVRRNNVADVKTLINNVDLAEINFDEVNLILQEAVPYPAKFEVATLLLSVPVIREHAIKHVKFLQHNQIEKLVQAFNPKIEDGGVCSGFTDLWIQAILANDEKSFLERLLRVYEHYHGALEVEKLKQDIINIQQKAKDGGELSHEEIDILEIKAFCELVSLHQSPQFTSLGSSYHMTQQDAHNLFSWTTSKILANTPIHTNPIGPIVSHATGLNHFFTKLKYLLPKEVNSCFRVSNTEHAIGLVYEPSSDRWKVMDINYEKMFTKSLSHEELGLELTEVLGWGGENVGLMIDYVSTFAQDDLVTQCLRLTHEMMYLDKAYDMVPKDGTTLFGLACRLGHVDMVKKLIDLGVDINVMNKKGFSPLFTACLHGRNNIINLLLSCKGLDVNLQKPPEGYSPLCYACQQGNDGVVQLLLKHEQVDVNLKSKDGATPFFWACQNGHVGVVKQLLHCERVDINRGLEDDFTPLHCACNNGHTEIAELILERDLSSLNRTDNEGASPLCYAASFGKAETVKLLLRYEQTDINQADLNGRNALWYASKKGHSDVVAQLLARPDIDVNGIDKNGLSPFWVACKKNHADIVNLFLNSGKLDSNQINHGFLKSIENEAEDITPLFYHVSNQLDPNFQNENGQTSLMLAIKKQNIQMVNAILQLPRKVDFNMRDAHSRSIDDYIQEFGNVDVLRLVNQEKQEQGIPCESAIPAMDLTHHYTQKRRGSNDNIVEDPSRESPVSSPDSSKKRKKS